MATKAKTDKIEQTKPTVTYRVTPHTDIAVGRGALVVPLNHPDEFNVTNGQHAYTSEVVAYDPNTGEFETKNTLYVPVSQ